MYSPLFKKYCCGPNIAESLSSIHAYLLPHKKGQIFSSRLVKGDAYYFFSQVQTCSCLFRGSFERRSCIISLLLFSVVFLNTRFSGITQCAFPTIVKSRPRHQLEKCISQFQLRPHTTPLPPHHHPRLLRSICPPCQSRGGAFANFALLGTRHLSTPGPAPNFWQARGFLSEYTYTRSLSNLMGSWPTQRILMWSIWNNSFWTAVVDESEEWSSQ